MLGIASGCPWWTPARLKSWSLGTHQILLTASHGPHPREQGPTPKAVGRPVGTVTSLSRAARQWPGFPGKRCASFLSPGAMSRARRGHDGAAFEQVRGFTKYIKPTFRPPRNQHFTPKESRCVGLCCCRNWVCRRNETREF